MAVQSRHAVRTADLLSSLLDFFSPVHIEIKILISVQNRPKTTRKTIYGAL